MAAAAAPNPFTIIYQAIRDALKGSDDLQKVVKLNNLIFFDTPDPDPTRDEVDVGDLPELMLLQGRNKIGVANSLAYGIVQHYPLMLTVDDLNVTRLNAVKWELFRAVEMAGGDLGLPRLIRGWTMADTMDDGIGSGQQMLKRGEQRWTSVTAVVVEATISRAAIRAGTVPTT